MIDFELPDQIKQQYAMFRQVAQASMRPISPDLDENEHEKPWDFINQMWPVVQMQEAYELKRAEKKAAALAAGEKPAKPRKRRPSTVTLLMAHMIEAMSWGDAGIYLCIPGGQLGGEAIKAVGTIEQKRRFLKRFTEGEPKWAAMAITEPCCGSDTANIQATARLDEETNEWVLNGEKIFVTSGLMAAQESDGFVVVWASVDRSARRAGIKSFVVEAGTPGMKVTKTEEKLGIRASDTVSIVFEECRIPYDNILGSPGVKKKDTTKGFKGVMKTFDASRPLVAASAMGIARATIEFVKETLEKDGIEIRYGLPRHQLTGLERDVMEMEAQYKAAWLLTLRAVSMLDERRPNAIESSMCKAKAGKAVTLITQKAVEILGPLGYSRKFLVEKWMRDAKINDLFEGTGQINTLIVARRILGFSRRELK
ncbi:MAG: acyl-CoA dehydrogenase family protein [Anaerolineales bacterium]|nr:acyl-CoA dehydrogenase family protein [Anaerolineales bacterium]